MSLKTRILELSRKHLTDIIAIRRDIHMHPELGFDVDRTAAIAAEAMQQLGLRVRTGVGKTGVIADLEVPGATRHIALRADMDALPIEEQNDKPYKSTIPGKAHMCGHDSHTAMLIGAARILTELRSQLTVNVRFIFQPNEEALPGGAPAMITDGALAGIDEIFGLHVWPGLPTGSYGICEGPALAQPDVFEIEIRGTGGHAAMPHQTVDPIVIAAQFVTAAQTLVSRNVNPLDSAVVSVTCIHGGTADNVIPANVQLRGTVRTFRKETQRQLRSQLRNMAAAITSMHGAEFTFNYTEGYPVTFNHSSSVKQALTAARLLATKDQMDYPASPTMGGEDFAYYTEKIPGCFIFIGCRNEARGIVYLLHDARFDIDEECMVYGMATHAILALQEPETA